MVIPAYTVWPASAGVWTVWVSEPLEASVPTMVLDMTFSSSVVGGETDVTTATRVETC
jgi:hypothetical protein